MKSYILLAIILIAIVIYAFISHMFFIRRLKMESKKLDDEIVLVRERLKNKDVEKYYENLTDSQLISKYKELYNDPHLRENDFSKYAEEEYRAKLIEDLLRCRGINADEIT